MRSQGYSGVRRRPKPWLIALIVLGHIAGFYLLARALVPDLTDAVERDVSSALTVVVTAPEEEKQEPPPPKPEPEADKGAQGAAGKKATPKPEKPPEPKTKLAKKEPAPRATSTGTQNNSGARDKGNGTGSDGRGDGTGSGDSGTGSGSGDGGSGTGGPDLVAVTKPSVRSGNLNTARDFPVPEGGRKTRFGKEVIVFLTVAKDGTSKNCSVRRSTVDAMTSSLVCGLVAQKIRFNPATNKSGEPVEARYGYQVKFSGR
ncbi:MAG: hypothetical protein ABJP34_09965 [Erythrobacter sp.]